MVKYDLLLSRLNTINNVRNEEKAKKMNTKSKSKPW